MTAQSKIEPAPALFGAAIGVPLINMMHDANIRAIERWQGGAVLKVTLLDGRQGCGWSLREAVEAAEGKTA